jgi:hypothetical protein
VNESKNKTLREGLKDRAEGKYWKRQKIKYKNLDLI